MPGHAEMKECCNRAGLTFGHGFANRFWKRNGLVSRAVSTKMRTRPDNFEQHCHDFKLIAEFDIKTGMAANLDETATVFIARVQPGR